MEMASVQFTEITRPEPPAIERPRIVVAERPKIKKKSVKPAPPSAIPSGLSQSDRMKAWHAKRRAEVEEIHAWRRNHKEAS
jgi:hypothetical protein